MQIEKVARDLLRYAKKIFSPEVLTVAGNGLVAAGEGLIKAGKHMRELHEILRKNNLGELWDSGKIRFAPPAKPPHDDDLPFQR